MKKKEEEDRRKLADEQYALDWIGLVLIGFWIVSNETFHSNNRERAERKRIEDLKRDSQTLAERRFVSFLFYLFLLIVVFLFFLFASV